MKTKVRKFGWRIVATLALGSRPRQGFARLRAKRETRESHSCPPGMQESVKEWTFTLPSEFPFWELESQWIFQFSKGDCRGQNLLVWKVLYIIGKILRHRCLKWVRKTHLDIWNTSYGPKKGQKSKLTIWLLTTKSRKLIWILCVQVVCNILLKFFWWRLQLCFKPYLD